jgi:hypothetical protein
MRSGGVETESSRIRWGWAIGGFLALEAVGIAAAFAWVAIYSYVLNPGRSLAEYQAYAQVSSPVVSLVVGVPAFLLAGVWFRRRLGPGAFPTAAALAAVYAAAEIALFIAFIDGQRYNVAMFAANLPTKCAAVLLGSRVGRRGA